MGFCNKNDEEPEFDSADIQENKAIAACSYLGILVLVPLLGAKGSRFAQFHARQGLTLFILSAAYSVAVGILNAALLAVSWKFYSLVRMIQLAGLLFPVFSIMGIMNAVGGKVEELPVIGKIRSHKIFTKSS